MADEEGVLETEIVSFPSKKNMCEALECPICMEIPSESIMLCSGGHSICNGCKEKVHLCPICQSSYSNIRNLALESIISMVRLECPYKSEGCPTVCSGGERRKTHTDKCNYREIVCNDSNGMACHNNRVPFSQFLIHLNGSHYVPSAISCGNNKDIIRQTVTMPLLDNPRDYPYYVIRVHNLSFLQKFRLTDSDIYWSVSVLGNALTASKYVASLKLSRDTKVKKSNALKLEWKIPVGSIHDGVGHNSCLAAVYPLKSLLKFCMPKAADRASCTECSWMLQISVKKIKRQR